VQKNKALGQMETASKAFPAFAQFINTKGLGIIVDNMEIRGGDQLKAMLPDYQKEQAQQQQQQQQLAMQNSPMAIKQLELQAKAQSDMLNAKLETDKIAISKQGEDTKLLKTLSDIGESKDEALVQRDKAAAERYRADVDLLLKQKDMTIKEKDIKHGHAMDILEHHHNKETTRMQMEKKTNPSYEE
jgi:hypothetical protein